MRKLGLLFVLSFALSVLPALAFGAGQTMEEGAAGRLLPTPAGVLPIVEEPVTLQVFVAPAAFIGDFNTNKATIYWEEMTGVHVDWIQVPEQDKAQKLTLMLSSGSDLPDVFSTHLSFEQVILYGAQGLFIPLNDLIDQYGHGIHKVFKLEPNARNVITAPDGNIYTLPYYNDCYHCRYAQRAWINVDWLQRLGLEMPRTTEELVTVLRAFKENDANGNGKADEIPLLSQANSWHSDSTDFLMNPFTFNPGNSTLWRYVQGDEVVFAPVQPGWKDGLRYLRRLHDEGLLDPESFSIDQNGLRQLTENPAGNRVGLSLGGYHGMFAALDADGAKHDYEALPPLQGPAGRQTPVYYVGITPIFVVTRDSEYPEIAYRWGDMMYDDEKAILGGWGQEDEDWRAARPGELGITGEQATWVRLTEWGVPHNSHWGQSIPQIANGDTYYFSVAAEQGAWNLEHELWKASTHAMKPYGVENKALPPLFLDLDMVQELSEPLALLRQHVDEWNALFITGRKEIDGDWDEFVNGLQDIGLPKVLEMTTAAYRRQYR